MASKAKRSPRSNAGDGDAPAQEAPKIDSVLGELESVVEELEGGELPLERALSRFEEGVKLARQGTAMLDAMEERVEVLLAHDTHDAKTVPFETDDEGDDGEV